MREFCHPHILQLHAVFVNNFEVFLISPIMCYCSCRDAMNNFFKTGFPELIISLILRDVLLGLEYLHRKGFVHRSIRSSHILLNQNNAVLCGFRECTSFLAHGERARKLHELPPTCMKNLNWLAPELLEQNLLGYTEKSDVYSIGTTTCELANSLEPFSDLPTTFMFTEKLRGNTPSLLDASTIPGIIYPLFQVKFFCKKFPFLAPEPGMVDALAEARRTYGNRKLSDHFHKFAEICMSRFVNLKKKTLLVNI